MGKIMSELKALNSLASGLNASFPLRKATKTYTFADTGTGSKALATVTGVVAVAVLALGKTSVSSTGQSTLSVGVTSDTDKMIAVTPGTGVSAEELWHDATPDAKVEAMTVLTTYLCSDDLLLDVQVAPIQTGAIEFTFMWTPITEDGDLTVV